MSSSVEVHEEIDSLEDDWDLLADRVGAKPFFRPGWFAAWWHAFGSGALHLIAIREEGELKGVLPLQRRRSALVSLTNAHSFAFGSVAESESVRRRLLGAMFADSPRRVVLSLVENSDAHQAMREGGGYRFISRPRQSPSVVIDGDWNAYKLGLSKNLRKKLRRCQRRLDEQGRVTLQVEDGREEVEHFLEEGLRVEAAGWKGAEGTAISSRPETRDFYLEVARWAAKRGCLRLAFLRLEERVVAFDYCFEENNVHWVLKTGYDPEFEKVSPGSLLRYQMLSRAFAHGIQFYDFLGDDLPWKRPWTNAYTRRVLLEGFAPSPLGTLTWMAFASGRPVAGHARRVSRKVRLRLAPDSSGRPVADGT